MSIIKSTVNFPVMQLRLVSSFIILSALLYGCRRTTSTVELPNALEGKLKASMILQPVAEKKFALDSNSSVRPLFTEIYVDSSGARNFTFLNTYKHAVYFYDYETGKYLKHLSFEKVNEPLMVAYHIKSLDSIYLFNRVPSHFQLVDRNGSLLNTIGMTGDMDPNDIPWMLRYPQYYPHTVTPIIEHEGKLIFSGEFMTAMPDSIVDNFRFTANINLSDNKVQFTNRYPKNLYGHGYNWGNAGLFNDVYYDIIPDKELMVISFPISHKLYLNKIGTDEVDSIDAASNFAGTISSFPLPQRSRELSDEVLIQKVCRTGLYSAILYDKYRDVYYRFFRKAMPDAKPGTDWKDKTVSVIMFDKDFKYLGETDLGTMKEVNWENAFVTAEGLNVEYTNPRDLSEEYITLKIFAPQKI